MLGAACGGDYVNVSARVAHAGEGDLASVG